MGGGVSVRTALYRHFDASGVLLYVGISLNAVSRLSQHRSSSHWYQDIANVSIEYHSTREAALIAERLAIINEGPLHNIVHRAANDNGLRTRKVADFETRLSWMEDLDDSRAPSVGGGEFVVFLVREIESKLFQGLFWAQTKAELWMMFDEWADPLGYEFALMPSAGALCHPEDGVDLSRANVANDNISADGEATRSWSWGQFEQSETLERALYDNFDDLEWEPFCAADEDYGLLAVIEQEISAIDDLCAKSVQ